MTYPQGKNLCAKPKFNTCHGMLNTCQYISIHTDYTYHMIPDTHQYQISLERKFSPRGYVLACSVVCIGKYWHVIKTNTGQCMPIFLICIGKYFGLYWHVLRYVLYKSRYWLVYWLVLACSQYWCIKHGLKDSRALHQNISIVQVLVCIVQVFGMYCEMIPVNTSITCNTGQCTQCRPIHEIRIKSIRANIAICMLYGSIHTVLTDTSNT